jgi:hypothetical protein
MYPIFTIMIWAFLLGGNPEQKSPVSAFQGTEQCLTKSSSEWGSPCGSCYSSSKSYRINLRNTCNAPIDVKLAVQEKSNRWRTFILNNMAPGDSISGYACEGTGKYVYWTRSAGDRTILFPTDEEIGKEFTPGN